ncbi:NAD(P)/FAD-dependent oxidoreductase [uncultured Arcticibacterium sp.]|uniref:NAD(P)/FAD-dependent oxidoreductase n=1 Tax=uncultured Arcticibacterium sp. TaxID=2173042 RepID=UPI0030F70BAA
MNKTQNFEVIIIGGSYAGLSAAMALGRSLRKTLIIDSGSPCNKQTPHAHNFITQDGVKPSEIASKAKAQVLKYPTVSFIEDLAIKGSKTENGFQILTKSGKPYTAKKLVFATGVKDILPVVKGFSECWGISVVHCPYCHGYEIRNQKTGIMANGDTAMHLASLVNNLTDKLTILTSGKADFDAEQLSKLKKHKIEVIEKEIVEIEHENGHLKYIIFSDGSKEGFTAAYGHIPFKQHTDIPGTLGCQINEQGYIEVDMMQKTSLDGVFSCGDNTSRMRSLSNAIASGNIAGAMANMELSQEEF